MSEEERAEEQAQNRGFKVTDRRRFTSGADTEQSDAPAEAASTDAPTQQTHTDAAASDTAARPSGAETGPPLEITFSSFVFGLSTQALMYLGEVPAAAGEEPEADMAAAQQMIDVLAMLQKKTSGNLETDESQMLEDVLYDLRMRYVKLQREGRAA